MITFVEYLRIPAQVAFVIIAIIFVTNLIGEIVEFKGKVAPECLKMRKYFARKKREREAMKTLPALLSEIKQSNADMLQHYSADNIKMRDEWIKGVNDKLACHDDWVKVFSEKLDKNNQDTLAIRIDNMRNAIIGFASLVIDETAPVTHEQFKRILKMHAEYEQLIKENNLTNGEVDIAHRIIGESYERHMRAHTFIEDLRGYARKD